MMRALTLKHPWPFAVCYWGKRIENRMWAPHPDILAPGEWFAIHGGKRPETRAGLDRVRLVGEGLFERFGKPSASVGTDVILPGIRAVARFGGVVRESADPWFEGPVGWLLSEVRLLFEPIDCPGAQGLWVLPDDIESRVREMVIGGAA